MVLNCLPLFSVKCLPSLAENPGFRPPAVGNHPVWLTAPLLSGECLRESASRGECNSLELFTDHCVDTDYIIMGLLVGGAERSHAVCVNACTYGLFRVSVSAKLKEN